MKAPLGTFLFLLIQLSLDAQLLKPVFKEGEFSGNIYSNYGDKLGYTWICTNKGIFKWDSRNLKQFTMTDGLPSNEVFRAYNDTKGRIWMTFYNGDLCYYYKDSIFNKINDTNLISIPKVHLSNIIETENGLFFMLNVENGSDEDFKVTKIRLDKGDTIHVVHKLGMRRFLKVDDKIILGSGAYQYNYHKKTISPIPYGQDKSANYEYYNIENINYSYDLKNHKIHVFNGESIGKTFNVKPNSTLLGRYKGNYIFLNQSELYQIKNNKQITIQKFKKQLFPVVDQNNPLFLFDENNSYKTSFERLYHIKKLVQSDNIHSLIENDNDIWILYKNYKLSNYSDSQIQFSIKAILLDGKHPSIYKYQKRAKKIILTTAYTNYEIDLTRKQVMPVILPKIKMLDKYSNSYTGTIQGFKDIIIQNESTYFASIAGIFKLSNNELTQIFNKLASRIFIDKRNRFWLSTADGIYFTQDFEPKITYLNKLNLKSDISIQAYGYEEDKYGNLLIATNNGVYIIKDTQIVYHLNTKHGLTSNECKKIKIDTDGSLWIATDNGVNHFHYIKDRKFAPQRINYFLKEDGILSSDISDFIIQGDSLYIASDKGLNLIIDKNWRVSPVDIPIHINDLYINGKKLDSNNLPFLNYDQNSIQIDFSAIYYERTDRVKVFYRLISDEDTSTQEVKDRTILLQSLAPNDYRLQIFAYDQDYPEIKSKIKELKIDIKPPFYKTWWFFSLIGIAILGVVSGFYIQNLRRVKEENTRLNLERDLSKFKLEALKAEMNPHFIFNCLNSIKDFILKSDIDNSQYYLSQLAKLIRIALYNTKEEFISLEKELDFIKLYVELEQLRFNHQFDYTSEIKDPNLLNAEIPTMVLQPFFENAIRHGKIGQLDKKGKLLLEIFEEKGYIHFLIKDNGIGIEKAQELKKKTKSQHKSMALDIIKERIQIYNLSYGLNIQMRIFELENDTYKTVVEIKYLLD